MEVVVFVLSSGAVCERLRYLKIGNSWVIVSESSINLGPACGLEKVNLLFDVVVVLEVWFHSSVSQGKHKS